jgi:hypothetical protein
MDSPGNLFLEEAALAIQSGPLTTTSLAKIHLLQAPFTPGANVTLAGSTEATFDGYAPITFSGFEVPHIQPNGNYSFNAAPAATWTPTGSTTPNTIAGWMVTDHAGNMVSCGAITPNVNIAGPSNPFSMVWGMAMAPWSFTSTILP